MGVNTGNRSVVSRTGNNSSPVIINNRIVKYSPLSPEEFRALFAGHTFSELEIKITLDALKEFYQNPENRFVMEDHRGDGFKLHLMVGLPRSGKSTTVKELGYPIMCPDTVRWCFYGERFNPRGEKDMWDISKRLVNRFHAEGVKDLIIDATNTSESQRSGWLNYYDGELHVIRTPVDEYIRRAIATDQKNLIPIIKAMAAKWDLDDTYKEYQKKDK